MKLIRYAGAELVTGNDIARAVLEHSAALAEDDTAETLEIPVLAPDGSRRSASLLVGPASQIVAEDVDSEFDELVDEEAVTRLRARTRARRPVAQTGAVDASLHDFDSWADGI